MATDGLWDVSENEAVARTVFQTLHKYPTEKHRYTMVAQELVAKARGKINDYGHWRLADSKAAATVDDISVIVIPVYQYYKEHIEWEQKCLREYRERLERERTAAAQAVEAKEDSTSTNEQITSLVNGIKEMAQVEIEPVLNEEDNEKESAALTQGTVGKIQSFIEKEQQSTIENQTTKAVELDKDDKHQPEEESTTVEATNDSTPEKKEETLQKINNNNESTQDQGGKYKMLF